MIINFFSENQAFACVVCVPVYKGGVCACVLHHRYTTPNKDWKRHHMPEIGMV